MSNVISIKSATHRNTKCIDCDKEISVPKMNKVYYTNGSFTLVPNNGEQECPECQQANVDYMVDLCEELYPEDF